MQIKLSRTVKRFFEPDTLVPFLIGTLFLSVTGNAVTDILKILFGDDIQGLVKIIFGSTIIFIICVWFFGKALNKSPKIEILLVNPF